MVDEQMQGGEPRIGNWFGDPTYPKCPHCARHWHGLPITEKVSAMYARGVFDESYRVAEDDTLVLCEGSEFIGPQRTPPSTWSNYYVTITSVIPMFDWSAMRDMLNSLMEWPTLELPSFQFSTWLPSEPEPVEPCGDLQIEFGPQNWVHQPADIGPVSEQLRNAVFHHWDAFRDESFPVPESPGYDFSEYAEEIAHGPQPRRRFSVAGT